MKKAIKMTVVALCICMACGPALAKDKILYVDSYHEGYAWSDGITQAIREVLDDKVELKIFRMDTKRNSSVAFKQEAAKKAKKAIESFKPDLVIVSDDNASKFLAAHYYLNASLPFVFCGVNWDASIYGFPAKNITGMIEVSPVLQLIGHLKKMTSGQRVGFLGPENLTSKKEAAYLKQKLGGNIHTYYSKDVEDWKKGFVELQKETDILIVDTDGGLYTDYADQLAAFAEKNTCVPTGTCYDFMGGYAMLIMNKSAAEQGIWAANTALKILGGADISSIPLTKNQHDELSVNVRMAEKAGIKIPESVMNSASDIIK